MGTGGGRAISCVQTDRSSMNVTETSAQGLKREFKVTIPASDFQSKLHLRLEELGRTVKLPGFRPGKVPVPLLKKRFGKPVGGEGVEATGKESAAQVVRT